MKKKDVQHEVLIRKLLSIESQLERIEELLNPTDDQQAPEPKIEVGSWWLGNLSGEKAKVTKIEECVYCTYEDGTETKYKPFDFKKSFTPCEAPQPQIEVDSWWVGNASGEKAQVTELYKDGDVVLTYENGKVTAVFKHSLHEHFTPCEAPKKETWYLCTIDYTTHTGAKFKRGQEYKLTSAGDMGASFEVDGKDCIIDNPFDRGIMVEPIER